MKLAATKLFWSATGAALALSLVACTAQGPDEGNSGTGMGKGDNPGGVDAGITQGGGDTSVPLTLDQLPTTTSYMSVPVSGTGPSGGTLLVDTDAVGEKSATISDDGSFCIDIPLTASTINQIQFQAIDDAGNRSSVVGVKVEQQGEPPAPTPDPEPMRDVVRTATNIKTTVSVDSGQLTQLVDGNYTDYVGLSNSFWDSDYVWIQTKEIATLDHVRVKSAADCPMTEYIVGESEDGSDPVNYYEIAHVTDGTGDDTESVPDTLSAIRAHWLLIWFKSGDCGHWYSTGKHHVIEVEAWTNDQGPATPPTDSTPTCATGG